MSTCLVIQSDSIARGPKLLSMYEYTVKQRGFLVRNTGKQVHLKHARRHFERNLVKDLHHRIVASKNWLKSYRQGEVDLTPADSFLWGLLKGKVCKNTPHTQRLLYAKRFKQSTSTLWEKCSRIGRNAFYCTWMWKETGFSIDYEQVLFCIFPDMCI